MDPLLAVAAFQGVGALFSSLKAPAAPPAAQQAPRPAGPLANGPKASPRFEDVLAGEMSGRAAGRKKLHFSEGVSQKMRAQGIRLSETQFQKLLRAVEEAEARGGEKALVLMDGMSFVVDVKQRMVTEIAERAQGSAAVHTRIDTVVQTKPHPEPAFL